MQLIEYKRAIDHAKDDYNANDRKLRQITEFDQEWFLNCLPPARMKSGGFVVGEPYTHNEEGKAVYLHVYTKRESAERKYYAVYGTLAEFDQRALVDLPLVDLPSVINLTCSCCDGPARGRQWFNRDTGYGLCHKCAKRMEGTDYIEMRNNYGREGEHYSVGEN